MLIATGRASGATEHRARMGERHSNQRFFRKPSHVAINAAHMGEAAAEIKPTEYQ